MHTAGRDSVVPGTGQILGSVHCAVSKLSEGCTIYGLNVGLPPHDYAFIDLNSHWQ